MSFRESIAIRVEGSAGDGVLTMGKIVARAAARSGYYVPTHSSFLAQVRGGQSSFQLRVGKEPVLSPGDRPDVVIALNHEAAIRRGPAAAEHGLIVHPPLSNGSPVELPAHGSCLAFDYEALAKEGGN